MGSHVFSHATNAMDPSFFRSIESTSDTAKYRSESLCRRGDSNVGPPSGIGAVFCQTGAALHKMLVLSESRIESAHNGHFTTFLLQASHIQSRVVALLKNVQQDGTFFLENIARVRYVERLCFGVAATSEHLATRNMF